MSFQEFSVSVRRLDGYAVVGMQGELDLYTGPRLEEALETCDGLPIVVDCTKLTFLGSHGIRILFTAGAKERLALVVPPGSHIRRVLDIVEADHYVPVFTDAQAAMRWTTQDPP